MGKALADAFPAARAVLDEVDAALGQKLSQLMFEGPIDQLTLTANAQPALMAASLAAMRVLQTEAGLDLKAISVRGGHSLGEYSALAAAGALSIADAAACSGSVATPCRRPCGGRGGDGRSSGAGFRRSGVCRAGGCRSRCLRGRQRQRQWTGGRSGHKAAIERAITIAQGRGAKRAMLLPVSAPFHCRLMQPAADAMAEALSQVKVAALLCRWWPT